jgi:hypothetical protein
MVRITKSNLTLGATVNFPKLLVKVDMELDMTAAEMLRQYFQTFQTNYDIQEQRSFEEMLLELGRSYHTEGIRPAFSNNLDFYNYENDTRSRVIANNFESYK